MTSGMTTNRRKTTPLVWAGVGILAVTASAGIVWWSRRGSASKDSFWSFSLVVTGDTDGWIVPCGCTSNQSGGLLRRGSYVSRILEREGGSAAGLVLADVGGAPG